MKDFISFFMKSELFQECPVIYYYINQIANWFGRGYDIMMLKLCRLGFNLSSVCKHYVLPLPSILQGSKRIWIERRSTLLWCGSSNISSNNNTSSSEWLTMTGVREVSKQWRMLLVLRCVSMCRVTTFPFLQSWLVPTAGKKMTKQCNIKCW